MIRGLVDRVHLSEQLFSMTEGISDRPIVLILSVAGNILRNERVRNEQKALSTSKFLVRGNKWTSLIPKSS